MTFGYELSTARATAGLSLGEMAQLLDRSMEDIEKIENDERGAPRLHGFWDSLTSQNWITIHQLGRMLEYAPAWYKLPSQRGVPPEESQSDDREIKR